MADNAEALDVALNELAASTQALTNMAPYLSATHTRYAARGLARREVEDVLQRVRSGQVGSGSASGTGAGTAAAVGPDGTSTLTASPAVLQELEDEAADAVLPLYVHAMRHSSFSGGRYASVLNPAAQRARSQGRGLTPSETYELITRVQRKEAAAAAKKAPARQSAEA